jgi:hypothetical protein
MLMMKESIVNRYLISATEDMIRKNRKDILCLCGMCIIGTLLDPFSSELLEQLLWKGFMYGHTEWMDEDEEEAPHHWAAP